MDTRDEALQKIAIDALRAIQRHAKTHRHSDLWQIAISRIYQTEREIDGDAEIAAIRKRSVP